MAIAFAALAATAHGETINFDKDRPGALPTGWIAGATGTGKPVWIVEADTSAPSRPNVLKQSGSGTYPWCVLKDALISDGFVEVKFKPLAGKEDQAGGVIWRWKDGDNYYVARGNALENNVSLYYMVNGSRKTIEYKYAPVAPNTWHTLRVIYKGDAIQVSLDGKTYIDTKDRHISSSGKAGVWTKADSVTIFDDFSHSNTPGK